MDVVIVYERKQRELDNSLFLKIELEKRGLSCDVVQFYEASKFNLLNLSPPKVIVVPHLYNTLSMYRVFARFGHASHIVNMQYEQVLSKKWEELGAHTPKDQAKKGIHICWGTRVAERLSSSGIEDNHIKIIPPLHLDMLRPELLDGNKKAQLALDFNLSDKRKWVLFISSFTYANIDKNRMDMNESAAGIPLSDFPIIHTKSRVEILDWFKSALDIDKETLLIYRPHPDELSLDLVYDLQKNYSNFIVIRESPVKDWINACDSVYTWYSTSIVEAHFMGKPYSILRPVPLSDYFDSVLLKHGNFITDKNVFIDEYLTSGTTNFAINDFHMRQYYDVDPVLSSRVKLADLICDIIDGGNDIKVRFGMMYLNAKLKSILVVPVYLSTKIFRRNPFGNSSLLGLIFTEIKNQIASADERKALENRISARLENKS